jgi:flagellar basal-body rod protein FlgF
LLDLKGWSYKTPGESPEGGEGVQGLIESASGILSASERRLENVSNNVSNLSTPGFKRQISFEEVMSGRGAESAEASLRHHSDLSQGQMKATGNPLDLAISGPGFFRLRSGDDIFYSRQGQFRVGTDGTVVTPQGHVLQQAAGGDLVLERSGVEILEDGTVLDGTRPVGKIGIYVAGDPAALRALGGSMFAAGEETMEEAPASALRQGMVEASNVVLGDEMVAMMATVRQAEGGARLVQIYDDLLGRAITTFGQGGK